MIIIDGKDSVLGRIGAFAAKSALQGEDVAVVNCSEIIITGNKKRIKEDFEIRRSRVGHSQKGPKLGKTSEKIVKRAIRGMLPNHRFGRGRIAFKRIKCYSKVPTEFLESEKVIVDKSKKLKFSKVREFTK